MSPAAREHLTSIGRDLEALRTRVERERLDVLSGQRRDPRTAAILEGGRRLGADAFRRLSDLSPEDGGQARGRTALRCAAAAFAEDLAAARFRDEDLASWSREEPAADAGTCTPGDLTTRVAQERDRARRTALAGALDHRMARRRPALESALGASWDASHRLGPDSYLEAWEERTGLPLARLASDAGELLRKTADLAKDVIRDLVSRRVASRTAPEWHDVAHAASSGSLAEAIPLGHAPVLAKIFLARLNLDATAGGRLTFNVSDTPRRAPAPMTLALEVPGTIRLVLRPVAPVHDLRGFLGELGRGLHLAHVDPDLPPADRSFLDPALPAASGHLLRQLAADPVWLAKIARVPSAADAARLPRILGLIELREAAAAIVGQGELARAGSVAAAHELGRELLAQAWSIAPPEESCLEVMAPRFAAATTLRGTILARALAHHLRERYDEDWFRNPRTGPFLLALWRQGGALEIGSILPAPRGLPDLASDLERELA